MFKLPDRFVKFISIVPAPPETADKVDGDCWQWTGRLITGKNGATDETKQGGELGGRGYGQVSFKWPGAKYRQGRPAHRVVYLLMTGHDPGQHVLDHLCKRRSCVNPLHLQPVTTQINTLRGLAVLYKINRRYADREANQNPLAGEDQEVDF